jgi:hypothetical protein
MPQQCAVFYDIQGANNSIKDENYQYHKEKRSGNHAILHNLFSLKGQIKNTWG